MNYVWKNLDSGEVRIMKVLKGNPEDYLPENSELVGPLPEDIVGEDTKYLKETNGNISVDNSLKTAAQNATKRKEKKAKGKHARNCCLDILDYIAGMNIDRELTPEQIDQIETDFSSIKSFLQSNRPWSAKSEVEALVPDEDLVTTEMKNDILEEFADYGIE